MKLKTAYSFSLLYIDLYPGIPSLVEVDLSELQARGLSRQVRLTILRVLVHSQ